LYQRQQRLSDNYHQINRSIFTGEMGSFLNSKNAVSGRADVFAGSGHHGPPSTFLFEVGRFRRKRPESLQSSHGFDTSRIPHSVRRFKSLVLESVQGNRIKRANEMGDMREAWERNGKYEECGMLKNLRARRA
jgi:hypothetical protein